MNLWEYLGVIYRDYSTPKRLKVTYSTTRSTCASGSPAFGRGAARSVSASRDLPQYLQGLGFRLGRGCSDPD